jgi:endoglucanase
MGLSQRFRNYCVLKALTPGGFFLSRGPRRQVFVCGVEVESPCTEAGNRNSNRGTARISRLRKPTLLIAALFVASFSCGCKHASWPLWKSWSARFVNPETGRVSDPSGDRHTTSEGQAYALFFSLAANDRQTFEQVLDWTQDNLASGDLSAHLPAWLWGKDKDGTWKVLDPNSASDADVWIAYSLLEAGRLWNLPHDSALGHAMMALIAKNEVANLPGFGPMLLPAPTGFQHGETWTLNPSYLPLFVFERLASYDASGPWHQIAQNTPRLLEQSSRHGYALDWVEYVPSDGFYPAAAPMSSPSYDSTNNQAFGSYDAIRVYLWAGMTDPSDPLRSSVLNAVPAMKAWVDGHGAPPERVNGQGIPLGKDGPVGFSAAVIPYLRTFPDSSQTVARQIIRINAQKSGKTGLYGKDEAYYDQCLALFSTGFLEARYRFGAGGELDVEWKRQ